MFIGDTIDDPIPVAFVETTQLKIGGSGPLEAYSQKLRIGNLTEWSRLWRKFAFEDTLGIGIKGKITVKTGPISTTLTTVKVQNFQGVYELNSYAERILILCRTSQRDCLGVRVSSNPTSRCRRCERCGSTTDHESFTIDRRLGKYSIFSSDSID
jgi:hypothetical protein